MALEFKLSQAKIDALSPDHFQEYLDYLKKEGVPSFEIASIRQNAGKPTGKPTGKPAKEEKVSPTLLRLQASKLTKKTVAEILGKYQARIVVTDRETGAEVMTRELIVKESASSGNVMFGHDGDGRFTLPGYPGAMQLSASLTASKTNELANE